MDDDERQHGDSDAQDDMAWQRELRWRGSASCGAGRDGIRHSDPYPDWDDDAEAA